MMQWYERLTIGKRIALGFLVVAICAGMSGTVGSLKIREVDQRGALIFTENVRALSRVGDLIAAYQSGRTLLRDLIMDQAQFQRDEHLAAMKAQDAKVEKSLGELQQSRTGKEEKALLDGIVADLKLYDSFRDKVVSLSAEGKTDEALNIMRNTVTDVLERIDGGLEKVRVLEQAQAEARYRENAQVSIRGMIMNILGLAASVAAALALGWWISRGITASVVRLTDTVDSFARGDLDARTGVTPDPRSSDQLSFLAGHFDSMAETIGGMMTKLAESSGKLAAAAEQLRATSEQMAEGAETVVQRIGSAATATGEMSATSCEIARNCSAAAEGAKNAEATAADGGTMAARTVQAISRIAERVGVGSATIEGLGQRSHQIGEIIQTIEEIADQTNLLALNAAIEAARAGEQGRGFSVVADEVRKLAERTARATGEISSMIRAIQSETASAVTAMKGGLDEVERGSTETEGTGRALEAIIETVREVSGEVHSIAQAAEEQTAMSANIDAGIHEITGIVGETARGAHECAAAAAGLAALAQELREVSGSFRFEQAAESRPLRTAETVKSTGLFGWKGRLPFGAAETA